MSESHNDRPISETKLFIASTFTLAAFAKTSIGICGGKLANPKQIEFTLSLNSPGNKSRILFTAEFSCNSICFSTEVLDGPNECSNSFTVLYFTSNAFA